MPLHYGARDELGLTIILSSLPEYWDYRCAQLELPFEPP